MSNSRERIHSEHGRPYLTRREVLLAGLGVVSTGAAFWLGVRTGSSGGASKEASTANQNLPPYLFTTKDLDALNGPGHEIQIDPANHKNQLYFGGFRHVTEGTGVYQDVYVSIDGGQGWTGVDRPAANGVNQDPDIFIHSSSFGGYSSNAARHEPGQVFQVTYQNGSRGSEQAVDNVSIQLAVAGTNGIEQIDLESTRMAVADNNRGVWSRKEVPYQYRLDGVDLHGQPVALVVNEPPSGK